MWWVLGLGFSALAVAFWFAIRPDSKHIGFLEAMARAILWGSVAGISWDLSTVAHVAARLEVASDERMKIVLQGFGESMGPGVMGFGFLMLVSFLTAIGTRRLDAARSA